MKKRLPVFACLIIFVNIIQAQNVGIGTASPQASAQLDVNATNKGVLLPRVSLTSVTDIATIPTPAISLLVFNTATAGFPPDNVVPGYYYWGGTKWISLSLGLPGTIATTQTVSGLILGSIPTLGGATWEFVGPAAQVTLTANQRVNMTVMAALGRNTSGVVADVIAFDVGYQAIPSGIITEGNSNSYMSLYPNFTTFERRMYTVSGTFKPGGGLWKIGMILLNPSTGNLAFFNLNDRVNITYMIINE